MSRNIEKLDLYFPSLIVKSPQINGCNYHLIYGKLLLTLAVHQRKYTNKYHIQLYCPWANSPLINIFIGNPTDFSGILNILNIIIPYINIINGDLSLTDLSNGLYDLMRSQI